MPLYSSICTFRPTARCHALRRVSVRPDGMRLLMPSKSLLGRGDRQIPQVGSVDWHMDDTAMQRGAADEYANQK